MPYNNETKLWQNVVLTAVRDAFPKKIPTNKYALKTVEDARSWLLSNSTNYYFVCNMAGIDPEKLHSAAKQANSQGWDCQFTNKAQIMLGGLDLIEDSTL